MIRRSVAFRMDTQKRLERGSRAGFEIDRARPRQADRARVETGQGIAAVQQLFESPSWSLERRHVDTRRNLRAKSVSDQPRLRPVYFCGTSSPGPHVGALLIGCGAN